MKLTCLGLGSGQGNSAGPASHLLEISGTHILLECPLDLSVLQFFLPSVSLSPHGSSSLQRKRRTQSDDGLPTCRKLQRVGLASNRQRPMDGQINDDQTRPFRDICGQVYLDVEPWYKTAELGLVDVSSLDAVLISNPEGMLGLPFLTRSPEFSGKIYATSVTTKLGQLMMEELVSMHGQFLQTFGRSDSKMPLWLEPATLAALPGSVKRALVDDDGVGRGNWHSLYSKKDVERCMSKVLCLHYEEEISIYDCLQIKPCSSGFELGASNWIISGSICLSYFAASQLTPGPAMGLNLSSHTSSDVFLFSDLKNCHMGIDGSAVLKSGDNAAEVCLKKKSFDIVSEMHISDSKDNPNVRGTGTEVSLTVQEQFVSETTERCRGDSTQVSLTDQGQSVGETTKQQGRISKDLLVSVCKAAVHAVTVGGSVLVTISGVGESLELLEGISEELHVSNLGHIPMFYVSPAAEETLVYANTVPEWLCAARQEKLYAGEALFGHVELLQEKRLHQLSALHAPDSVNVWKEPCVVFASHWSLRMGPAVSLLQKWQQDPHCLLILTQDLFNIELALSPFLPIAMKVLEHPRSGRLRGAEVADIIEKLKAKLSLLPGTMEGEFQQVLGGKSESPQGITQFYNTWSVSDIPVHHKIDADMSADLACHFHPKHLDSGVAVGQMVMSLHRKGGKWSLDLPTQSEIYKLSFSARDNICWGAVETGDLVKSLEERGLYCEVRSQTRNDTGYSHGMCIIVRSPSFAKVELRPDSTLIETDDPVVRQLVTDAVKSLLYVI